MPDPSPIFSLVKTTRQILRSSWVATGLGLCVGLLLGTLVIVALIDLIAPPGPRVTLFNLLGLHLSVPGSAIRFLGLLAVLVPTTYALVMGVIRPLLRRLKMTTVARRIEMDIPGIHNRLVSTIDLSRGHGTTQSSPAFYRRLIDEALERIHGFRPSSVVDFLSLRRASLFAFASILIFTLAFILFSDRLPTAVARIFNPFADIPPVTGVHYNVNPGTTKVLRGEDIPFLVEVDKGDPKSLYVQIYGDGDSQPLHYDLQKRDKGTWKFTLSGQMPESIKKRFRYRVFGGGTWSKEYEIALVERPKIAGYHTLLHYPEYMGIPEPREGPALKLDVAGPEESRLEVVVQTENGDADSPEESAAATGEIQILEPRRVRTAVVDRPERIWLDDQVPPGAKADGWQWDKTKHERATHTDSPSPGALVTTSTRRRPASRFSRANSSSPTSTSPPKISPRQSCSSGMTAPAGSIVPSGAPTRSKKGSSAPRASIMSVTCRLRANGSGSKCRRRTSASTAASFAACHSPSSVGSATGTAPAPWGPATSRRMSCSR
jgi:hypothetical protein